MEIIASQRGGGIALARPGGGYNPGMLSVAIQAGGDSKRMGQNKALMNFQGQALIERTAIALRPIADEMFAIANQPELYAFLGIPILPDLKPHLGPLGGLHTALQCAASPSVAAVACDLPFANPQLFIYEQQLLLQENADIVVPSSAAGLEPLHAVYRRKTCLPLVAAAIAAGNLRMSGWFQEARVRIVAGEELNLFDPDGVLFMNLNTPADVQRAEQYANSH